MQSKLQELTDKIYQEGVSKGNEEAQRIIGEAKKKADDIISNAKSEAESLVEAATKKAGELEANAISEIKLASKQAVSTLKQDITNLISDSIIKTNVGETVSNNEFIQSILKIIFDNWSKNQVVDYSVTLPETEQSNFNNFVSSEAKQLLDKGLQINYTKNIHSGFEISPSDGAYKVSFSEEDFKNFFKQFIRPKLVEYLFDAE